MWNLGVTKCPVATFLCKQGNEWMMIDAGFDTHVEQIVEEVKATVGQGNLTRLFITHGHLDHVAAIPQLLAAYPKMIVSAAPLEQPFLCEAKKYSSCAGDSWIFNFCKYVLKESRVLVPLERFEPVQDGQIIGGIQVCFTPGHTPGSTSYLHLPSKSMMVGDAFMFYDAFSNCPSCQIFRVSTFNYSMALESLRKLIEVDVDKYHPAHDASRSGITKKQVQHFLE